MRILHVTPTYIPAYRYGGPIRVVHELNKWLVRAGVDITVYTTDIDGPNNLKVETGKEMLMDGVKVVYFPASFPRSWFYSREMAKAIKTNIGKFNVVHVTSTFLAPSFLVWKYSKFFAPYIISTRGNFMKETFSKKYWKKKIYYEFIEKKVLAKASAVHFTAKMEYKEYKDQKFPLKKEIILPNGIDDETFSKRPEKGAFRSKLGLGGKKIILFMSRISWKKGFDTLIPAMKELIREIPNAVLVVAGGDDERYLSTVKKMIDEEGISSHVIFTGLLTGAEQVGAYQDSDVFVLPSYSENFANVLLEAGYFRLPVVATEGVALAEDFAEAAAGFKIRKDVRELSYALTLVLSNREVAKRMGEAGERLVREKFFWPEIAGEMINAYNEVINRKPA